MRIETTMRAFAGNSLFIFGYEIVYIGLHVVTAAQWGVLLTEPDLPLIYILANLKWMTAFSSGLAFVLAFPRHYGLEWIVFVLLVSFPLVGVAGLPFPALEPLRLLPFLLGMPLLDFYFWKGPRP